MKVIEGFKFVRKDGTTHNGYQWPLPTNGKPVRVKADPGGREFTTVALCPQFEGDGLCVALTARAASSGGVSAGEAIGLWLTYKDTDILAEGDGKCRVKAVTVTGIFDVAAWVRTMCGAANLRAADLSAADLRFADLRAADLRFADLRFADLCSADLCSANLSAADLRSADLCSANLRFADLSAADLRYADLRAADLCSANLRSANLRFADLRSASGREDWDALVARGAIR